MKSYHFSLGDSGRGPVGFCARVTAESKEAAVKSLKLALENGFVIFDDIVDYEKDRPAPGVEYIRAYVNLAHIGVADIDEENEPCEDCVEELTKAKEAQQNADY